MLERKWLVLFLRTFGTGRPPTKTFPTSGGWGMKKKKEEGKKLELVRLPYRFKFQNTFSGPCVEWLEMIESMCNEILGNYTKKEDQ
jgi:hypothetical protein